MGAQTPTLSIGSVFQGGYEILSELGEGSFGRVYKARQHSTGQEVAIKVLRFRDGDGVNIQNQVERFRRESRLCAQLSHPNIVRLIDSGESADAILYAVFEFVPGATLKDTLIADGKLSVQETVHLMSQVLDALSCAHARGVVHRDLKPENIMITKTGARRNALVLDFGLGGLATEAAARTLSRITATHELLGTPCYAAPEQLRGEAPTPRSDLYSWGLILLECLTGDLPVQGASAQEVILKQLGPEPIAIPSWLRHHPLGRIIELVTAKRVDKRDISIESVLHMFGAAAVGEFPEPSGSRPEEGQVGRERRQVTIVCCRLTISASSGREPDVEEVDQLLQSRRRALAERTARAGGTVATILADRIFLVFGYPQAREDDARRAARMAVAIAAEAAGSPTVTPTGSDLQVGVRIGVHTGLVIVSDLRQGTVPRLHELTGVTPQIASYLVERAGPGEVLVSFDTQGLLRQEFEFEAAGVCEMSELSRPLPVYRLNGVRRTPSATDTTLWTSETPLVGRSAEVERLRDGWVNALAGRGSVVVVTGEAGIGKSRLVHELRKHVGMETWLECGCAPESQTVALAPVCDLLLAMDRSVEALLTRAGLDLAEHMPLFSTLLSLPPDDRYEPLRLSPERQKELTLQALVTLLFRRAEQGPLVLVIENVHWADPTTIELATLFIQELRAARYIEPETAPKLYLVFTTRPEFVPPWSAEDVAFLPLQRLGRAEVEAMVRAGLAREGEVPVPLVEQVVQRADGVPLFVEEITRLLRESSGHASAAAAAQGILDIPTSLRDLLTARLDSVSSSASDTAQRAAVIGREFRFDVLQAMSPRDAGLLRDDIGELGRAGLIFHRRGADTYVFRHALLRDAAYESLTRPARQGLHLQVAEVLQRQFPDVQQHRPEILALHCERGGQLLSAAEHWHRAGEQAIRRAAYVEGRQQLERGLALLRSLPDSPQRKRDEIELLTTLGAALSLTGGYAAEEVGQTFRQASEVCEQLGDDVALRVLYGLWSYQLSRGDRAAAAKLVPRFQRLAATAEEQPSRVTANAALAAHAFWQGNFREAEQYCARGRQLSGTGTQEGVVQEYGYEPGLYCYIYGSSSLWQLGYPSQAEALRKEMLETAERARFPYLLCLGIGWSLPLLYDTGDTDRALQLAEELTAVSTEQRLYLWLAIAACAKGGALVHRGDPAAGVAQIQQGLGVLQGIGVLSSYCYYLSYLAEAYLAAGDVGAGLAAVDEGLAQSDTLLARFHQAELYRLKGELLVARGDHGPAENHLQRALAIARAQAGKSFELRATMSYSRLLRAQGKTAAARDVLGNVYNWFTEGFDTRDLRAAKALLGELA